jgi:hypothetical protein
MSLDLYFESATPVRRPAGTGIFVRRGGATAELTAAEAREAFPDATVPDPEGEVESTDLWRGNCTHNLTGMAAACGLCGVLWRPEENGITTAADLLGPLGAGLADLIARREELAVKHSPPNGWGTYDSFRRFVEDALRAAIQFPDAAVRACR